MLQSRGLIRRALRKVCCNAAQSLVIATDQARKAFPPSWMSQEQIFVVGCDHDENIFRDKLAKARTVVEECVRKYKLFGKNVILFVGRLVRVKNIPLLLEAFAHVSAKNPNTVLAIVGGGPDEKMLRERAAQLGITDKTIILGHQEGAQLHVWYLISSMLVLPSTSETYGAVVNESLISGLPVLCSTHAGASVLISEGENGNVFDPYDVDRLSQLIEARLGQAQTAEVIGHCNRESLMPISFEETVTSFVNAVECAARNVGKR
jgi:glycosyltransferase involved in cell wall biosynthesis